MAVGPERIEVEAEPFDPQGEAGGGSKAGPSGPTGRAGLLAQLLAGRYGTVLAGLLLDTVDFTTLGPIGVKLGFPVGALCGWWLARSLGYPRRLRLGIAVACGLYCMLPPTSLLPVATVLGLMARQLGWAPDQQEE